MTEWLGLPPLATAHGGQIDNLIGWIHIFMLVLFVGWGGFFTYCLIRFRRSRNPVANYHGSTSHTSIISSINLWRLKTCSRLGQCRGMIPLHLRFASGTF